MVLLTMTTVIVEALETIQSLEQLRSDATNTSSKDGADEEKGQEGETDVQENKKSTKGTEADGGANEDNNNSAPKAREQTAEKKLLDLEPSLKEPKPGNPISNGQVLDLWRETKALGLPSKSLDALLRGSRVYVAPPKPKPEPVSVLEKTPVHLLTRLRQLNIKSSWPVSGEKKTNDLTNE